MTGKFVGRNKATQFRHLIAFNFPAARAIQPEDGIDHAFDSGVDFICLGMFDFQVKEDAEITRESVARAKGRERKWF